MNKKKINMHRQLLVFITLFVFGMSSLFAQKGSIQGIIVDEDNSEPIPFATIAVMQNGSATSAGTVSDSEGIFQVENLSPGNYDLVVSYIGFLTDTVSGLEITRQESDIDLGRIAIKVSKIELDEVEITSLAKTASSKIDRRAYRAEDFETAKGGTAVDILNKLPSVAVSPDGDVSVRGTTDFMVYLNGKP